jgi:hypothetical protein
MQVKIERTARELKPLKGAGPNAPLYTGVKIAGKWYNLHGDHRNLYNKVVDLEQQNARLKELRLDPQFQKPWIEGDIPAYLEGGAGWEDAVRRIEEERRNPKAHSI